MNLSQRQKILLGVFFLGLVALVADRTILRPQGGPQAASAESAAPAPKANRPPGSTPGAENPSPRASLAERLSNLSPDRKDGSVELRDPFALPVSWPGNGPKEQEKAPDPAAIFARTHQLKAVVVQGEDVSAQVDDGVLVPGQTIDGFELVSVDYHCAVFEREGKQVVLELVVK